jgi:hypothetical protein
MPIETSGALQQSSAYLSGLKAVIEEASSATCAAYDAIANVKDYGSFDTAKPAAIAAVDTALASLTDEVATNFRLCGETLNGAAHAIFEGVAPEEDPITEDGLSKVDEYLPTNSLHQPAYLEIHDLAQAIHEAMQNGQNPADVEPNDFMYRDPNQMHGRTILTRTVIFMKRLREAEESDWVYSIFNMLEGISTQIEQTIRPTLFEIKDALESDQLRAAAIELLNDPTNEQAYLNTIDLMLKGVGVACGYLAEVKKAVEFYEKLIGCLTETDDTIAKAYVLYKEANETTF